MSRDKERKVYQTGVNEPGRRFCHEKLWKGHRPVDETLVEFQREIVRVTDDEAERKRSQQWLEEYEEALRG